MAYGHGISVSLLQLARAYTVFTNGGELLPLTLLKRDGHPIGRRVITNATSLEVTKMMEMAVMPGGTAPRAQVPGYRVAGKTGTAHKAENGGYAETKYRASFVGFGPVTDPRFIVAVMIDEPQGKYYERRRCRRAGVFQCDGCSAANDVGASRCAGHAQRAGARRQERRMIAVAKFTRPEGMSMLDRLAQLGVPLMDLTADSRSVKMGSIFVAYPGTTQDGRMYISDAIARGAAAVLWERGGFTWNDNWEVPNLGIEGLRGRISEIAGHMYGNASETLWMAGVTGTNGKTSVSQWIAASLEALGQRSAVIGTLGNGLIGERVEAKNTTPDPIVLQRLLADYLRRGARNVAMEVSSHGIDQGRVAGIKFDVAVFTNLTRDHLDYHGTMESYADAKFKLFSARGVSQRVVNIDDPWGARLAASFGPRCHHVRNRCLEPAGWQTATCREPYRPFGSRCALPCGLRVGRR